MGNLNGRVAVVAGGSGGFGAAVAQRFKAQGATVLVAARNGERLAQCAAELGVAHRVCDLTSSTAVAELAAHALQEHGRLDIAVNCAGYEDNCPIATLEPERVEKMVAVQFTGALYFIQHMANAMRAGGAVITIGSLTATLVAEGYAPYSGAKAGINHVTRVAAAEYGAQGVRGERGVGDAGGDADDRANYERARRARCVCGGDAARAFRRAGRCGERGGVACGRRSRVRHRPEFVGGWRDFHAPLAARARFHPRRARSRRRVTQTRKRARKKSVARREGVEPPTPRFEAWCSIQLSYRRVRVRA